MNIQKLNPIGYEATTPDGKKYKKSNLGKTIVVAGSLAIDTFGANTKYLKQLTLVNCLRQDLGINVPNKYAKAVNIGGTVLDALLWLGVGSWIDKKINDNRISKLK